jgi:hypothetical protein
MRPPAPGSVGGSFPKVGPGGVTPGIPATGSEPGLGQSPPHGPPHAGRTAASDKVPGYVPPAYVSWVQRAARGTGLPASVVAAQINEESGFNPSATSSAGAQGIAQFLPSTFAGYGRGSAYNPSNALGAYINYMNTLLKQEHGNVRNALAAYNAGPGNLAAGFGYADTILGNAGAGGGLRSAGGTGAPRGTMGGTPGGGRAGATPVPGGRGGSASFGGPGSGGGGFHISTSEIPGLGTIESLIGFGTGVGDVANALGVIANDTTKILKGIDWLFVPSHWIRILAFLGGSASVALGVFRLSHVGGSYEIPVVGEVKAGATALPVGIALVGFGGILLFIAFHNLPSTVSSFPELLTWVEGEFHKGGTTAAAGVGG